MSSIQNYVLNPTTFIDSSSGQSVVASGSFTFNSGTNAFSNVNITVDGVAYNYPDLSNDFMPNDGVWETEFTDMFGGGANFLRLAFREDGTVYSPAYYKWTPQTGSVGYYPSNNVTLTTSVACFLKGTCIDTIQGVTVVDALKHGDKIVSHEGLSVEVKWVGRQRVHPDFAKVLDCLPVCITAGALGNGVPVRDLYVSPDHAIYIDETVLVHARALINDQSIYQVTQWQGDIEYFHIETEKHEIILAEGAPTETFIDNVSRRAFYNHAEYETLYPDAKPMVQLDIPRIKYARQLPMSLKLKLNQVAGKYKNTA